MRIGKDLKLEDITYCKTLLTTIISSSMEKNFFDQPINSDTQRYKEIRQLTTGQGEDYTAWILLDYDYIKKSLQTNCSWFKQANRIRCWSKNNSANRICWKIKESRKWKYCQWIHVCLNNFRKNQRNNIKISNEKQGRNNIKND